MWKTLFLSFATCLLFSAQAFATCSSYPNTLTNGTAADASQVMANFNCAALTSGATIDSATLTGTTTLPGSGTITSSGQVGIGTTSPSIPNGLQIGAWGGLQAYGGAEIALRSNAYYNGTNNLFVTASGYGSSLVEDSSGNLIYYTSTAASSGIGTTATFSNRFQIAQNGNATFSGSGGTCTINGSGSCTSDLRLKKNIMPISGPEALDRLGLISGVTYRWADPALDQKQRVGVIAQSVLKAFPQLVGQTDVQFKGVTGKYYTVDYAGLVAPLVSAVNELDVRTRELVAVNGRQAAEIDRLQTRINALELKVSERNVVARTKAKPRFIR